MSQSLAKILVVDDEEDNLTLFEHLLTRANYTVVKARDGLEALDKFDKCQPDLVMTDLMMPRLNGYDVCAHLRRKTSVRHVPILLLTSLEEDDTKATALRCGADAYLNKPVQGAVLLEQIRSLLQNPRRNPAVAGS